MTSQNVNRLNLKTCKHLAMHNFLTQSGKEYCEFAVRARIVELEQKQAEAATKAAHKLEQQAPELDANVLPPVVPTTFATRITQAVESIKELPSIVNTKATELFVIAKKARSLFSFTKTIEQVEQTFTTSYRFEVRY